MSLPHSHFGDAASLVSQAGAGHGQPNIRDWPRGSGLPVVEDDGKFVVSGTEGRHTAQSVSNDHGGSLASPTPSMPGPTSRWGSTIPLQPSVAYLILLCTNAFHRAPGSAELWSCGCSAMQAPRTSAVARSHRSAVRRALAQRMRPHDVEPHPRLTGYPPTCTIGRRCTSGSAWRSTSRVTGAVSP